jgi:hypothetical protein
VAKTNVEIIRTLRNAMNAQSRLKEKNNLTTIRKGILSCWRKAWMFLVWLIDQLMSVDVSEVAKTGNFSLRKGVL